MLSLKTNLMEKPSTQDKQSRALWIRKWMMRDWSCLDSYCRDITDSWGPRAQSYSLQQQNTHHSRDNIFITL